MEYVNKLRFYRITFNYSGEIHTFYNWAATKTRALNLARRKLETKLNLNAGALFYKLKEGKLNNEVKELKPERKGGVVITSYPPLERST